MTVTESFDPMNDPTILKLQEIMDFADNSPNTKKAYLTYTIPFVNYCHDVLHKDPIEVTHNDIRCFLDTTQEERSLSNRTINHAMSEIKKLLVVSGYQWDDIQVPHKAISTPTLYVPTKSRIEELINSIDKPKQKAMVTIMYSTGARVSETCHLKCKDIYARDGYIHIAEGKRRKGRDVPLADITYQVIKKYWLDLPPNKKTRDWLFTQERNINNPADPEYIEKFLKRHLKAIGWEDLITPHTLRRAFATHLYIDGVNIEKISRLMGHSSIMSTLLYVHLAETMLALSVKSPIESLGINI